MDPAPPAAVRAVIIGLLLAAVSAGTMVAFSVVAGRADDPSFGPITPVRVAAVTAPVVTKGTHREPPDNPRVEIRIEPAGDPSGPASDRVLGTRVRNHESENKTKPNETANTATPHAPEQSPSSDDSEEHYSNGNAYGHYKDKARGNAYGHSASPGSAAKASKKK